LDLQGTTRSNKLQIYKKLLKNTEKIEKNVMLEVIARRANLQTTSTIYNKEAQPLAYADDIDIVGTNQSAVQNAYLALEREAAKVGLDINEQKTKYMIAARNDRTIRDLGQIVAIGDKHFEAFKEFVYLGSLMTPTNDVSLEIQRKIQTGNRCFFELRKHLRLSYLSRKTHHSQDLDPPSPAQRHSSETWVMTKRRRTNCSYLRESFSECQTQWKEKSRKTKIQVGGWSEQR
jgi:hypothetical protein